MKILFVCTGNTCRSPMAEMIASSLIKDISFDSAGVFASEGKPISYNAEIALLEKEYDIKKFKSKRINEDLIQTADLIFTMTKEQKEILKSFFIKENYKIFSLKEYNSSGEKLEGISDPFGGDIEKYRKILLEIEKEVIILKSRVIEKP